MPGARGRERLLQLAFLVPAVAYLLLFFGYPVVQNALMGFQEYTTRTFYTGEAPWVGLDNYATVMSSNVFGTALLNTVLFTVGSVLCGMAGELNALDRARYVRGVDIPDVCAGRGPTP